MAIMKIGTEEDWSGSRHHGLSAPASNSTSTSGECNSLPPSAVTECHARIHVGDYTQSIDPKEIKQYLRVPSNGSSVCPAWQCQHSGALPVRYCWHPFAGSLMPVPANVQGTHISPEPSRPLNVPHTRRSAACCQLHMPPSLLYQGPPRATW